MPALTAEEIASMAAAESSADIRARVDAARLRQRERFRKSHDIQCNAEMTPRAMRRFCELDGLSRRLLEQAMSRLALSARAYDRVLKVARTIADLAASETVESAHLAEAIHYRALDKAYFRSA